MDAAHRRIRFVRRVSAAQARLGTGILTLDYPGDSRHAPAGRAPARGTTPARLTVTRPRIVGDHLRAARTVARAARGVVRVQLEFHSGATTTTRSFAARIAGGR